MKKGFVLPLILTIVVIGLVAAGAIAYFQFKPKTPPPTPIISPIIKIETPAQNMTIFGDKIPVVVSVKNFQLVDYQNNTIPKKEQGHIILWLDDPNKIKEPIRLKKDTFLYGNVAYGEHTLRAELVNNDDTPISPPVTSTVKFNNKAFSTPQPD